LSRVESKHTNTYLDGFFVFYQSVIPLAYISPGYVRNNAIPSLNSWTIHVFMKQERNNRKVWETSFKNKVIPALILFIKTYMYRIPHNIHSIFIFMFIEKTLNIIINITLHNCPPMCQCQNIKVTHEVMTNAPHWLLENGSHSGKRIGVVPKYD
jgi:hypothetical protein